MRTYNKIARALQSGLSGSLTGSLTIPTVAPVAAGSRYWRILATDVSWYTNQGVYKMGISRLSLYSYEVDLALTGVGSASSRISSYYNASAPIDGLLQGNGVDTGQAWESANSPATPQWIIVTLPTAQAITSVSVEWYSRYTPKTFNVQNSDDGITWNTVASSSTLGTNSEATVVTVMPAAIGTGKGYFAGGGTTSTIDKLSFSTELIAPAVSSVPSMTNYRRLSSFKSDAAGYWIDAGTTNSLISTTAFSTDLTAGIAAKLITNRDQSIGMSGNTKGYSVGGSNSISVPLTSMEYLTFATGTESSLSGALTNAIISTVAGQNAKVAYISGGWNTNSGIALASRDHFNFATEVMTQLSNMSGPARRDASTLSSEYNIYLAGGINTSGTVLNYVDKISFVTGATQSSVSSTAPPEGLASPGYANSWTDGYLAGGSIQGGTRRTGLVKMNFATDTWSTKSAVLPEGKNAIAGVSSR